MSRWRTPNGESASTTALTMAGGIPIVPASPIPLAPRGLRSDGLWAWPISARGLEPGLGAGRKPLPAVGELGHAGQGDRAAGRSDDAEAAVDRDDVVDRGLQHAGRESPRLLAHVARGKRQRGSAEGGAAAPERADPLGRAVRVAVTDRNRFWRHAELIGDDLGERRLMPLAVSARAGDGEHGAGLLHADEPALPAEA